MEIVFKSIGLRKLLQPFFLIVGLLSLTPALLAATISSTLDGGDWDQPETWVDEQVPTAEDSAVINGPVVFDQDAEIQGLTVSSGATLSGRFTTSNTLTVTGNVLNEGTITSKGTIDIWGNLTNNGTWDNEKVVLTEETESTISGTNDVTPSTFIFGKSLTLTQSLQFAEFVEFSTNVIITVNSPYTLTFFKSVSAPFSSSPSETSLRITGTGDIIFAGETQEISATAFIANNIEFSGTGTKTLKSSEAPDLLLTTMEGLVTVQEGATLTLRDNLEVTGMVINRGTIRGQFSSSTLTVSGNITNEGTIADNLVEVSDTPVSSQTVSKVLTNADADKVELADVQKLLPPDWALDTTTGELTAPVGEKVTLKVLPQPDDLPVQVTLPPYPTDLNAGFGVGGMGTPVLDGIKQSLTAINLQDFALSQDDKGIFQAEGANTGINMSFIPDTQNVTQVDQANLPPNLSIGEGGFYQITTPKALQVQFIPSPKDPVALSKTLDDGEVALNQKGDVLMEIPESTRQRGRARLVAIFDPIIQPAPDDLCVEITPGNIVCDFDNAPESLRPGFHQPNDSRTRAIETAKIVYQDGTSQTVYPTLLSPDIFIKKGFEFDGVEKIVFNANGTFYARYQGLNFLITPNFEVEDQELAEGESVAPSIAINPDGTLTYTVTTDSENDVIQETLTRQRGKARRVLSFKPRIEPVPDDLCVEIEVGKIICDFERLP